MPSRFYYLRFLLHFYHSYPIIFSSIQIESQLVTQEAPDLGRLYIAKLLEILQIAVIAAAGLFYSKIQKYQRLFYDNFAVNTVKYFYNFFLQEIRNLNSIVFIVEDSFERDKRNYVYNTLKDIYLSIENANSVIVSIGIISLLKGSN